MGNIDTTTRRSCRICSETPPYRKCGGLNASESSGCAYIEELEFENVSLKCKLRRAIERWEKHAWTSDSGLSEAEQTEIIALCKLAQATEQNAAAPQGRPEASVSGSKGNASNPATVAAPINEPAARSRAAQPLGQSGNEADYSAAAAPADDLELPEEITSKDYPSIDDWLKAIHAERKTLRSLARKLKERCEQWRIVHESSCAGLDAMVKEAERKLAEAERRAKELHENGERLKEAADGWKQEAERLRGIESALFNAERRAEENGRKYYELIYAVGNKFPEETRHQTALRYIQEREQTIGEPKADAARKGGK